MPNAAPAEGRKAALRRLVPLLLVGLSACVAAPEGPQVPPGVSLAPGAQGIEVVGTGQEIGFGRHQPGAVAAVSRVLGERPQAAAVWVDCPGGTLTEVRWPRADLSLYFDAQAFVGWTQDGAAAGRRCGAST